MLITLLSVVLMTGCGNPEVGIEEKNEEIAVEVANAGVLGENLGIIIKMPADFENVTYNIINEETGEMKFAIDKVEYSCLVEGSVAEVNLYESIKGETTPFEIVETGLEGKIPYTFMVNKNFANVVTWNDENYQVAYTLYTVGTEMQEETLDTAKKIMASQGNDN